MVDPRPRDEQVSDIKWACRDTVARLKGGGLTWEESLEVAQVVTEAMEMIHVMWIDLKGWEAEYG